MLAENTLLQAAISHLELALANICEQTRHHELGAEDRRVIDAAATALQRLTSLDKSHEQAHPIEITGPDPRLNVGDWSLDKNDVGTANEEVDTKIDLEKQTKSSGTLDSSLLQTGLDKKLGAMKPIEGDELSGGVDLSGYAVDLGALEPSSEPANFPDSASPNMDAPVACECCESQTHLSAIDIHNFMIDAFDTLDGHGDLNVQERALQELAKRLGFQKQSVRSVFVDRKNKSNDGLIHRDEWICISRRIIALHSDDQLIGILKEARRQKMRGHSVAFGMSSVLQEVRRHRFLLSYKSCTRVIWDLLLATLLVYISFVLPLMFAFEPIQSIQMIDGVVDWIFMVDLLANFRTTFVNDEREEVWDARAIAIKYLKSWFVLDLVSSVPLEQLSAGIFPRMQAAKLLKFGKIAKATKMLRVSKIAKFASSSEIVDLVEEFLWTHKLLTVGQGIVLLLQLIFMSHWLACLLIACGGDSVEQYWIFDNKHSSNVDGVQKYCVALYWAIMTMTTVGYGDVPMRTDLERVYAIISMIAGGAFYGYIIGVMTTLLARLDMDRRAVTERMTAVITWLDSHYELSPYLRRRVWRHFKEFLTATRAVEDSIILNDLPPQLYNDVCAALLHDSVRNNPLFENCSIRALSRLVAIMTEASFQPDEDVVETGDAGDYMFIVDRGRVHIDRDGTKRTLCVGDSFGEETLFRDIAEYEYSVRTSTKVHLFKIHRNDFVTNFKELHEDFNIVSENFDRVFHECGSPNAVPQAMPGAASLIGGGTSGMTPSFPEAVLEHFDEMNRRIKSIHSITANLEVMYARSIKDQEQAEPARRHIVHI